jgi:hypothetical protein
MEMAINQCIFFYLSKEKADIQIRLKLLKVMLTGKLLGYSRFIIENSD